MLVCQIKFWLVAHWLNPPSPQVELIVFCCSCSTPPNAGRAFSVDSVCAEVEPTLMRKIDTAYNLGYNSLCNAISKSLYCINRNVHPDPVGAVS